MPFYTIAVDANFKNNKLTYSSSNHLIYGDLVRVPLGNREVKGIVLGEDQSNLNGRETKSKFKVKEICGKIENYKLNETILKIFEWMSLYYHYDLGQLVYDFISPYLESYTDKKTKNFVIHGEGKPLPYELGQRQREIVKEILSNQFSSFSKHYIMGVTGSGKTAIYISLIREILNKGKSVLFLIPEINLSPQTFNFFKEYLSCPIFVFHSGVTKKTKYLIEKETRAMNAPFLVLGTRSASFLPYANLGLIIIDEEHDQSYKQDDHCPYNARDVLVKRADLENLPIILGSATPSTDYYHIFFNQEIEPLRNQETNNFSYKLESRIEGSILPQFSIIPIEDTDKKYWPFTEKSFLKIKEKIEGSDQEQVIVFINRTGYSNYLQCKSCGESFECKYCSTKLKFFKKKQLLECPYCYFKTKIPEQCPKCHCLDMIPIGIGTEKVVNLLEESFPKTKVTQFDREQITNTKTLERQLQKFASGDSRILVGTQMVSKGHNFKNVNLVVILGIDSLLNFPDFRNNEKVFQMINQVSGRAGRFGKRGEVIINTLNKDSKLFSYIENAGPHDFYKEEIRLRRETGFPPFSKMAIIYTMGKTERELGQFNEQMKNLLQYIKQNKGFDITINGPISSYIEKKRGFYTQYFVIRSKKSKDFHLFLNYFQVNINIPRGIQVKLDVDPYQAF